MSSKWHGLWSANQACDLALSAPKLEMRRQLTFSARQCCLGRCQQHVSSLPECSITCKLLPPRPPSCSSTIFCF